MKRFLLNGHKSKGEDILIVCILESATMLMECYIVNVVSVLFLFKKTWTLRV